MESDAIVKTVQVAAEELEAIRRVLRRVDALGRGEPDLVDRVAVAMLDGPDLVFALSNDWDVMQGAWKDVAVEVATSERDWPPETIEALWWGVRTTLMTPDPAFCYDPIPLIRAGEKTHTLRGQPRKVGSIAQVTVAGKRIPLWLRFSAVERLARRLMTDDDFAWADGFRPPTWREDTEQPLGPMRTPSECLRGFMAEHARRIVYMCGPRPPWLLHFEVVRDEMSDNEWEEANKHCSQPTTRKEGEGNE